MESVNVICPLLEVTLTEPIDTILVESYTFPVSQTCEQSVAVENRNARMNETRINEMGLSVSI